MNIEWIRIVKQVPILLSCDYEVPSDWENFFSRFCPGPGQNGISPGFAMGEGGG